VPGAAATTASKASGASTRAHRRALELLPFVETADWLLDLHSMGQAGPPLVLTGLQSRHIALARELAAPGLVVADAGHAQGPRLRDHGRFAQDHDDGTRSLLVECGFHGEVPARDVAIDLLGRLLLAAGTLVVDDLPAGWLQTVPAAQQLLEVTDAVTCAGGEPFHTPYADCTLIMPSVRRPRPGLTIVRLARDLPA
jgi:hypothetical protein